MGLSSSGVSPLQIRYPLVSGGLAAQQTSIPSWSGYARSSKPSPASWPPKLQFWLSWRGVPGVRPVAAAMMISAARMAAAASPIFCMLCPSSASFVRACPGFPVGRTVGAPGVPGILRSPSPRCPGPLWSAQRVLPSSSSLFGRRLFPHSAIMFSFPGFSLFFPVFRFVRVNRISGPGPWPRRARSARQNEEGAAIRRCPLAGCMFGPCGCGRSPFQVRGVCGPPGMVFPGRSSRRPGFVVPAPPVSLTVMGAGQPVSRGSAVSLLTGRPLLAGVFFRSSPWAGGSSGRVPGRPGFSVRLHAGGSLAGAGSHHDCRRRCSRRFADGPGSLPRPCGVAALHGGGDEGRSVHGLPAGCVAPGRGALEEQDCSGGESECGFRADCGVCGVLRWRGWRESDMRFSGVNWRCFVMPSTSWCVPPAAFVLPARSRRALCRRGPIS